MNDSLNELTSGKHLGVPGVSSKYPYTRRQYAKNAPIFSLIDAGPMLEMLSIEENLLMSLPETLSLVSTKTRELIGTSRVANRLLLGAFRPSDT